jgi:translation initiation factor 2-alpha kinase 4
VHSPDLFLAAHPGITRPLNFRIQRSGDGSKTVSWEVSVLTALAEKGSMHDLLDTVGALNIGSTRAWAIQLIEGLEFYHRNGIIHAGVHLNNVLLEKTETGTTVVKLSDGGYHQDLHLLQNRTNAAYSTAASAYWNAPEVSSYAGGKPVAATDVWDLGVILLQMMFGLEVQSLYQSPNALLETLDLSRSLRELLDKVFKADFKKRPSSFELLPSEFLRNDDPILEDQVSQSLTREDLSASLSTFKAPRQRRDSMHAGYTSSRYANDFVESGRLGRGGYGEVVKARNKLDGRFYAIKRIRQSSPAALDNVLSEIILLSQLNHPHVVRYFTAWIENEGPPESEPDSSSNGSSPADGLDVVFGKSSGALDFISSSGPNIQFGYGSDEEDISSEAVDEDDSDGGEVEESDNVAVARRRSSSHGQATKTTLYIQMEYCERQVTNPLSTCRCAHFLAFVCGSGHYLAFLLRPFHVVTSLYLTSNIDFSLMDNYSTAQVM